MIKMFVFACGLVVGVIFDRYLFNLAMSDIQKRRRSPEYNAYLLNRYHINKKY